MALSNFGRFAIPLVFVLGLLAGAFLDYATIFSTLFQADDSVSKPLVGPVVTENQISLLRGSALPELRTPPHYPTPKKYNSTLQFVLIVGLEGTGHRFVGSIAKNSPDLKRLEEWNLHPNELGKLHESLFDNKKPWKGMWNAHCNEEDPDETDLQKIQRKRLATLI